MFQSRKGHFVFAYFFAFFVRQMPQLYLVEGKHREHTFPPPLHTSKHLWPKPPLPVVRHTQAHLNVNTAACRKCKLYVHAALQWPAKSASQTVRS